MTAAAAKSLQSCPTLCDPMVCSPPGFSIHGILQARTLEWVAISFSRLLWLGLPILCLKMWEWVATILFCSWSFLRRKAFSLSPLSMMLAVSLSYVCVRSVARVWLFGNAMDYSPSGSSVHGIFQARMLEGLLFPTPGHLPDPGVEPMSLASPALDGGFFITVPPGKPVIDGLYCAEVSLSCISTFLRVSSMCSLYWEFFSYHISMLNFVKCLFWTRDVCVFNGLGKEMGIENSV